MFSGRLFIARLSLVCLLFSTLASATTIKVNIGSDTISAQTDIDIYSDSTGLTSFICPPDDTVKYLSKPGQPQIPWKIVTIILPPDADITSASFSVNNASYSSIDGTYNVSPAPLYATWDENGNPVTIIPDDRKIVDGYDISIYNSDSFWPEQAAEISQKGNLRQWKLVELAVPLVGYNPQDKSIQELENTDIDITYAASTAVITKNTGISPEYYFKQSGRVKNMADNYDQAVSDYTDVVGYDPETKSTTESAAADDSSTGYAIITTDDIVNSSTVLADFITNKQKLGWNVHVVTESDWGGGTGTTAYSNIHTWLANNYISLDIMYVLLIGTPYTDTGTVPMLMYDDGRGTAPTDFFYASFTGDAYWEVAVGRIPYYGSITSMDAILQKTIDYENSADTLWQKNTFIAMARLDDTTPMYQCGEQIKKYLTDPMDMPSVRMYEQGFDVTPEYTYSESPTLSFTDIWRSKPYGLVFWGTHGLDYMAQYFIDNDDVPLLNDNYPSIVFQGSCQNAWPEYETNLAYSILKNGAVVTIAATRNSFYSPGVTDFTSDGCNGGLTYRYARQLCYDRESAGVAWENARQDSSTYLPCRTRYSIYGDPSITPDLSAGQIPVSQGMTASAYSYQSGNSPANANDGSMITRWAASTNTYPQWWKVDLGSVQPISKIVTLWYGNLDRSYQYSVLVSDDGSSFSTILDNTARIETGPSTDLLSVSARYVGIRITGVDPSGGWAGFWECQVYGGDDQAPAVPTDVVGVQCNKGVKMDWQSNQESDIASYTVKRSEVSGGPYTTIASDLTTSSYIDVSALLNKYYYYVITAIDCSGNESDYSYELAYFSLKQLAGHYKMDDDFSDSSGNNYNAVSSGSPAFSTGHTQQAIIFDGTDDMLKLPAGIADSTDITIAAWVYWNGGDNWQRIFDFGNGTDAYMFLTPSGGTGNYLRFGIINGGSEQIVQTSQLSTGKWVHVAVTLQDNTATLYVNGVSKVSSTITINPNDFNPVLNYIGDSQWSSDPYFSGKIDDFRVYNFALSASQIAAVYSGNTTPVFSSDPISNLNAKESEKYSNTMIRYASGADGIKGSLIFTKNDGPDWLNISDDGTMSGTPEDANVGENIFSVSVTNTDGLTNSANVIVNVANIFSGTQGIEDLSGLALNWLTQDSSGSPACNGADLDGDNTVTITDFAILANNWLNAQ